MDFIYIDDVCRAILAVIERSHIVDCEVLNIGSGTGKPLSEVASQIAGDIEACPGWRIKSNRQGDVDRYIADISRSKSVLDFSPTVSFERGLSETTEWYRNNPVSYE